MGWPDNKPQPAWQELKEGEVSVAGQPCCAPQNPSDENLTNFKELSDNFVPKFNRLLLKRDITTSNHPCAEDLAVGELVVNAVTGNLYTKLVSGRVIMYQSSSVCDVSVASLDFNFTLNVPDNSTGISSVSGGGITFTSDRRNKLRFNPVPTNEGLPVTYDLSYQAEGSSNRIKIGRISAISDYKKTMSFELIYYPSSNNSFYPLSANFSAGTYDNKSLGTLILELV